jgi:hypothetical protein
MVFEIPVLAIPKKGNLEDTLRFANSPSTDYRRALMHNLRSIFVTLPLALTLACYGTVSWCMVTAEDQKLIEAADCDEIIKEHRNFSAAEKKLAEEIRQTSNSTTAGNVLGVATLAVFGLGFFSWNDQADAKTNLAELTAYREAIAAEGRKKNCKL